MQAAESSHWAQSSPGPSPVDVPANSWEKTERQKFGTEEFCRLRSVIKKKGEMNFANVYQRQILRLGGIMAQQSPPAFSGSELISPPGEITGLGKVPNS